MTTRRSLLLKLIIFIVLLIVTGVSLAVWSVYKASAQRSGNMELRGLAAPVSVFYDAWGVPHIDAQNDPDAYRTLGYLHAQDRLFQMDVARRIGGGRLSELFGQSAFATDRFFRTLGISRFARQYAERMEGLEDAPHVQLIKAYQDGINQFIDSGRVPVEYRMLLTRPDYFHMADIAHVMGYMAYSHAEAFKTDALIDHVRGTLGDRHLQDLVPGWPGSAPQRAVPGQQAVDLSPLLEQVAAVERHLPAGRFLGSNAWAVRSSRSQSGSPLLANDPHMGFAAPGVWYEAHIRTPEHEVYGHFLAGLPFALLGQTRHHAWGLTMLMNDELDFYRERVNPDNPQQVWAVDRWQKLQSHEEVIKIRGQEDRLVKMRSSRHGPIINDQPGSLNSGDRRPVSLFWTFLDPASDSVEAFYGLSRATSMAEFEEAASRHWSPGLNLIYADVEDNIAMWAIGRLKRWPNSNNSFGLLNGASGRDDFLGYQPFTANPRVINPREGQLFSANNPYDGGNPRRIIPGYYAPSERANRIAELLDAEPNLNLSYFKAMQMDNRRPQALAIVKDAQPLFQDSLLRRDLRAPAARAAAALDEWDGSFHQQSLGATIYQRWHSNLMRALFADELGPQYDFFKNTNMAEKSLASLYWKPASPWWDNRQQPTLDGRQAAIEHAWVSTVESLVEQLGPDVGAWKWEQVAELEHRHALTDRLPWVARLFNSTPVPVNGGRETLNNMTFSLDGPRYEVTSGPSTRRLVDLGDLNGALGIIPLGQSGNPFDGHYADQADMFNQGRYRTHLFDWSAIEALPDRLRIQPARRVRR